MASCNECKHYTPQTKKKGDCFGHEVSATMDVENCPAQAFEPR